MVSRVIYEYTEHLVLHILEYIPKLASEARSNQGLVKLFKMTNVMGDSKRAFIMT